MSDSFDPYRVWLGIPPESRPPTHYEMLGISPKEQERAVIEAAVLRQSGYVRNFQIGQYGKDAARLLNEIAAAKACLLDPAKRAKYDAQLKGREAAVVQPAAQTVAAPLAAAIDLDQLTGTAATLPPAAARLRNPQRRLTLAPAKRKPTALAWQIPVAAAAAIMLAVLLFVSVRHRDGDEPREQPQTADIVTRADFGAAGSSTAESIEEASELVVVKGTVLPSDMAKSTGDAAAPVRVDSTATAAVSLSESMAAKLLSEAVQRNSTPSSRDTPVSAAANKLLSQAVAWYRAEGNAEDSAARHHGKLKGGVALKPIKVGQAFELNGKDGCVVISDAPELNPAEQMTMMAWIRPESAAWADVIAKTTEASGAEKAGFHMGISPEATLYAQFNAAGEPWAANQAWGGTSSAVGGWLHVAATYDGRMLLLYANGVNVGGTEVGRKTIGPTDGKLVIGGTNAEGDYTFRFKGGIDEVALFNRGLSNAEIQTIYRGTLEGKAGADDLLTDAVAWYRADGNADDSAGAHKGTLEGGVAFKAMKSRRVFDFDGTGSIVVANSADLNPQNRFTVMAWICPRAISRSESLIISKIGKGSGNAGYELGLSPDNASLFLAFNAPGEARRANTLTWLPRPIAAGEWAHIAGRYNGDALHTFLNGAVISGWNCGSGCGGRAVAPSSANFRISGDDNRESQFDGLVDNVAFFNRALSNAEISTIYHGTFGELRGEDKGDFVRLRAGGAVQTADEYAGPIDVSFVARTDGLNIRLFSNGHESVIWNWELNTSELRVVRPNGGLAIVRVTPLEANRWYGFRYVVTPQGTKIWVDGKAIFEESQGNAFFPPSPVKVVTAFGSIIDVKDFIVKPIEWLTAEQEAVLARHTNAGTIDVLALLDPARDAKSGKWTADFDGLHSPRDSVNAALRLPVAVPDEYCLTIVAERAKGWKGNPALAIGLLGTGAQFNSVVDWNGASGLEQMDGKSAIDNESTTRCGMLFRDGEASVATYFVRRSGVQVLFDGRQILDWRGGFARLRTGWGPYVNAPLRLFLGTHCDWHFKAILLTPLSDARPLADQPPKDLLKTIELAKHARGGWALDGPVLVSPANVSHAGVRFPGVVPDEYRLRIVAERPRGFQGPPQLHVGLVTQSSQATLVLDADHKSGLEAVGGKMYQENATTFQGDLFIDGVESTIDCTVGKEGIRVDFDGHTIINWHGDLRQLKPTWTQFGAPKRTFWIGTHCNYRIKKIELLPHANGQD